MNKRTYQSPRTLIMEASIIYMNGGTIENTQNAQTVNNVELDSNSSQFFDEDEPALSSNVWE